MIKFEPKYILLVTLAVLVVVSVLMKEERVKRIAIGSIIGWFAAITFVGPLLPFVEKVKVLPISKEILQITIFGLITALIGLSYLPRDKSRPDKVSLRSIALMILALGSIGLAVLTFVSDGLRQRWLTDYNLVALFYNLRIWWMMIMVGFLLLLILWPRAKKNP